MKKIGIIIAAFLALAAGLARAGFDQYTQKNYTTIITPSLVGSSLVSNATPADAVGLIGNGSLVFAYAATNTSTAVLSFTIGTSATTNGTYSTWTNADGVSAWAYTNSAGFARISYRPNAASRYVRVYVTPTSVTNGIAGAILVTE